MTAIAKVVIFHVKIIKQFRCFNFFFLSPGRFFDRSHILQPKHTATDGLYDPTETRFQIMQSVWDCVNRQTIPRQPKSTEALWQVIQDV